MIDAGLVQAFVNVVQARTDDVIGALFDALYDLSEAGHDRLDLMALLWAVQLRSDVLSGEAMGLVGDAADALLGQCHPSQIIRLAQDPPGEAALVAAAADAAARWRPPSGTSG